MENAACMQSRPQRITAQECRCSHMVMLKCQLFTQARDRYPCFSSRLTRTAAFFQESWGVSGTLVLVGKCPARGGTRKPLPSWNENTYHSPPCFRTGDSGCDCYPAISSLRSLPTIASTRLRPGV